MKRGDPATKLNLIILLRVIFQCIKYYIELVLQHVCCHCVFSYVKLSSAPMTASCGIVGTPLVFGLVSLCFTVFYSVLRSFCSWVKFVPKMCKHAKCEFAFTAFSQVSSGDWD